MVNVIYKIRTGIFVALLPCALSANLAKADEFRPLNATEDEKWILDELRSDEFNNNKLDYTKWIEDPKHVQTWTWNNSENAELSQGSLKIKMVYDKHKRTISNACSQGKSIANSTLYFKSAMLQSKASGILGYYEARIKGVSTFPGFSPAFWMYSNFDDSVLEAGSVRYSEIDVVEMQQRQSFTPGNEKITDHNLHAAITKENAKANPSGREWRRPGKYHEQENVHVLQQDPGKTYHVYGAKVTTELIIWYVDNIEVGRSKNMFWKQRPMQVALSLGLRKPFTEFKCNGFVPLDPTQHIQDFDGEEFNQDPPTMTVDYVRTWIKG
ncbi:MULTISPECIES: family 16 glycosylhydrolase [Aliiglaciecola]|uniref:family 16 glycosylhydrolase n=1 Tax=Aliiglaciecola TaxID=1406885 RepID=UPI001C09472B|nr:MULTISPECIES: family 16 glycosylhydrolase [Aliiglaciecola]MBU2878958.1 family 16 glycosylhydrolase [Aliiglaciecola lipolytica]MDO6710659.1 family 16 glycosylhydrolase [Aliiglaciecola sp. 2_MG-2023]MDO6751933.1 family 16 glycosylhydrolase [Aliiglaciecola sp. 1_MG-2023]